MTPSSPRKARVVTAEGGLALTIKTEDSITMPAEEMEGGINPGSSPPSGSSPEKDDVDKDYVLVKKGSETYTHPPLRETMSNESLLAMMNEALRVMRKMTDNAAGNDPESQQQLDTMIKKVQDQLLDKTNMPASSSSQPVHKKQKPNVSGAEQLDDDVQVNVSESDVDLGDLNPAK